MARAKKRFFQCGCSLLVLATLPGSDTNTMDVVRPHQLQMRVTKPIEDGNVVIQLNLQSALTTSYMNLFASVFFCI